MVYYVYTLLYYGVRLYIGVGLSALLGSTIRAMREPSECGPGKELAPRFFICVFVNLRLIMSAIGKLGAKQKKDSMATKEELYCKTKEFILNLSSRTSLSSFYIGKAKDVNERQLKHSGEGYFCSIQIAKSSSSKIIDDAEKYLISQFKKGIMPIIFDNDNNGGGGNPKADRLDVSLRFNMASADDLDDVDEENLFFETMEL